MDWLMIIKYLLYGWMILIVALAVNVVASTLGVSTWYDYVTSISVLGLKTATLSLRVHEHVFLFVIYPGIFGLVVYSIMRFFG